MMTFTHWQQHLPADHAIYALIDPLADNQPLHYWFRHASDTQAWPLYGGTEFTDDILHGPWLLPLAQLPSGLAWWQEQESAGQAQGVLIASPYPVEQLVRHWQSLLIAGLDGEEVLFRYYDPRVLAPMLATYTETEICQFLGPTTSLLIWDQADWRAYSPYPKADLTEHTEPWWRMQPAHFVGQPGKKEQLINSLDDWLWQNKSALMMEWLRTNDSVRLCLSGHYDEVDIFPIPAIWLPSLLVLRLFNYHYEWQVLQHFFQLDESDEQTDLLQKVTTFIEQQQAKKGILYGQ